MVRILATFWIVLYAVVPPGFCMCRLSEALLACDSLHEETSPEEEHDADHDPAHEDDCDCPQLKPDCTLTSATALEGNGSGSSAVCLEAVALIERNTTCTTPPFLDSSASLAPLYVMLRALRI